MEAAAKFLEGLEAKSREKVLFNMWKAKASNDREIFKKLTGETWEFRTFYQKTYIRFFAFWDKSDRKDTIVISTHGFIKKTGKVPMRSFPPLRISALAGTMNWPPVTLPVKL